MVQDRRFGLFWILLGATGYAFLPIFARAIYAQSNLAPTDIALWRFIFATPVIWLMLTVRERATPRVQYDTGITRLRLMSMGILYAGAALAAFSGLQYIPASTFVVLFYTYPAFVALLSLFLGQRLRTAAWIALGLTLIGIVLTVPDLSFAGENTTLGIMIAILNALLVAIYFVVVSRVMRGASSILRGSAWVITGTLIVLLLTALPIFGLQAPQSSQTWLLLIGLAIFSTAIPIFVLNIGIQMVGAAQAAIISAVEPVMTMLLALVLLNEIVLPIQWVGAGFIIAAVILLERKPRKKATN